MCTMMNLFYGLKALTKNEPISFEGADHYKSIREMVGPVVHDRMDAEPQRLELTSQARQLKRRRYESRI